MCVCVVLGAFPKHMVVLTINMSIIDHKTASIPFVVKLSNIASVIESVVVLSVLMASLKTYMHI